MLNRSNFEIAELAPTGEGMEHLAGILVAPGRTAVTDGLLAVTITAVEATQGNLFLDADGILPAEEFEPFVLDRESALRIARAIPRKTENEAARYAVVDASSDGSDRATVSVNDLLRQEILRARKMGNGKNSFPNVEKAIPDRSRATLTLSMNPDLLALLLKAVAKFCRAREVGSIAISVFGAGEAVRIDADGFGQFLTAVIMPQGTREPDNE